MPRIQPESGLDAHREAALGGVGELAIGCARARGLQARWLLRIGVCGMGCFAFPVAVRAAECRCLRQWALARRHTHTPGTRACTARMLPCTGHGLSSCGPAWISACRTDQKDKFCGESFIILLLLVRLQNFVFMDQSSGYQYAVESHWRAPWFYVITRSRGHEKHLSRIHFEKEVKTGLSFKQSNLAKHGKAYTTSRDSCHCCLERGA